MTTSELIKVAVPQVGEEEVEAVREVLLSGQYVSGSRVEQFEQKFAQYIGTDYAVAVSNGTSALYIALESLGIQEDDEVIVPPMSFFATISAVLYLRAKPVFADIDMDDLCLSPRSVEQKITPRTRAIIPVHLYGASAKMDEIIDIADRHGLIVLEDCAQAHGTEYRGNKVGGIGHAGSFSFFATKHMTTGEGGMITTNDHAVVEQSRIIRNHGMSGRDAHVRLGFNDRMTEMQAAMGIVQLRKLDELNSKRVENSEQILHKVKEFSWARVPVPEDTKVKHTYFWCPVMVRPESGKTIDDLKRHLTNNNIGFRSRYKEPLYRQPVFSRLDMDYSNEYLPNAEKAAGNIIGLPNHPGLSGSNLNKIIDTLHHF